MEIIKKLSGGSQSGRAEAAKKYLSKLKEDGNFVERPFVPKKRSFTFPKVRYFWGIHLLWSQKMLTLVSKGSDYCIKAPAVLVPVWTLVITGSGSQTI